MTVNETSDRIVVRLPERCEIAEAVSLHEALARHAADGRPLLVDWGDTTRLHTAAVQTLVAAAQDRESRGHAFAVTAPGPDLAPWLDGIGVRTWVDRWATGNASTREQGDE